MKENSFRTLFRTIFSISFTASRRRFVRIRKYVYTCSPVEAWCQCLYASLAQTVFETSKTSIYNKLKEDT